MFSHPASLTFVLQFKEEADIAVLKSEQRIHRCTILEPAVSINDGINQNFPPAFGDQIWIFQPRSVGLSLTLCFRHKKAAGDSRGLRTETESLHCW